MACFYPVALARDKMTAVGLNVPCGRCIGCKLERSRMWATRCMHEASLYRENTLVTLTFADEHLPECGVSVRDLQLFLKRTRKKMGRFRYYGCGEYGENFGRPHYHVMLFDLAFPDCVRVEDSQSGNPQWQSETLASLWSFGAAWIGEVNFESAAYIARYCTKKITGDAASEHYERVNPVTGELVRVNPEFGTMSRRPGIGRGWIEKYHGEVYRADAVLSRGHESKPPRYYDVVHESLNEEKAQEIARSRALAGRDYKEATDARLQVRRVCTEARLNLKRRRLEQ